MIEYNIGDVMETVEVYSLLRESERSKTKRKMLDREFTDHIKQLRPKTWRVYYGYYISHNERRMRGSN